MKKLKLQVKEKTKVPKGITNEDAKLVDRVRNIFIVADGIGGHPAGDEASNLAVVEAYQTFRKYEPYIRSGRIKKSEIVDYIVEAINKANEVIYTLSSSVERFIDKEKRAGTTMLFGYFFNNYFYIGNVGDSRAYLLRGDKFRRLTQDDSSIDTSLDEGAQKLHELQGLGGIRKYLGQNNKVEPKLTQLKLKEGDVVLMTTDGLTKLLFEQEIGDILYGVNFEKSLIELTRAVNNPRKLISYYANVNSITEHEAKKHIMNRDSITLIALKAYKGG